MGGGGVELRQNYVESIGLTGGRVDCWWGGLVAGGVD